MVCIRFTSLLGQRIGGLTSVEVSATTVESALHAFTDQYPAVTRLVWSEKNVVNPMMALFLNDKLLEHGELSATVKAGDQIEIVPAVSGG